MYAIIKTGGKQYKVAVGDTIFVEKLEGEVGDTVDFTEVLAIVDGEETKFGSAVGEAKVSGEIVKHGLGKKIRIFKYKAKKGYRRRQGHRQPYTRVSITAIG
ncbi:MAG: 50S ribosomal protein L21 [Fastidiosipilaceae bacterium]|jgi:large subunit ribosomal protein L21|nr:50S ribosomal protein L21 [Clostridiaceae bacterium]